MRRRAEVARQLMEGNIERQRNADLKDDGELLGLIELKLEENRQHLEPSFNASDLHACSVSARNATTGSSAIRQSTEHLTHTSTTSECWLHYACCENIHNTQLRP